MTPRRSPRPRSVLLLATLMWFAMHAVPLLSADSSPPKITVFAAISLSDALEDAGREFTRVTGVEVRYSFASSAQLARQIAAGAKADVFISADASWMDELRRTEQIKLRSERRLAGNHLVVIQPANLPAVGGHDWIHALGRGRLATGDPQYVPLGRYAREALTSLGIWTTLESRLARAENARVATVLVARGEAPLGIVYATDARSERRVRVITTLDSSLHSPIVYSAALMGEADDKANAYFRFLMSTEGQKYFARHGFAP